MTGTLKIPINGVLEPGNNVSATSSYTVQPSDLDNGSVTNSAYATAGSTISNTVILTVTATQPPCKKSSKSGYLKTQTISTIG